MEKANGDFHVELASYNEEQKKYLEILSKFAMRGNKSGTLHSSQMPMKKEGFVRDNLFFLNTDEQVEFNDCKRNNSNNYNNSFVLAGVTSASIFTYFIVVTPVTRSLFKEAGKSLFLGILSGYGYYKYHLYTYQDQVHKYYVKILNRRAIDKKDI